MGSTSTKPWQRFAREAWSAHPRRSPIRSAAMQPWGLTFSCCSTFSSTIGTLCSCWLRTCSRRLPDLLFVELAHGPWEMSMRKGHRAFGHYPGDHLHREPSRNHGWVLFREGARSLGLDIQDAQPPKPVIE